MNGTPSYLHDIKVIGQDLAFNKLDHFKNKKLLCLFRLLTHKWHELLVLTTSAYQAIHGTRRMGTTRTDGEKVELHQEVSFVKKNLRIFL